MFIVILLFIYLTEQHTELTGRHRSAISKFWPYHHQQYHHSANDGMITLLREYEQDLETLLKSYVSTFREDHDLTTHFDDVLSHLLNACLVKCENDKLMRASSYTLVRTNADNNDKNNDEFEEGVKRWIPVGHTFKGCPAHFPGNPAHMSRIFHIMSTKMKACQGVLLVRGDVVRFGVRVRVFPFAERVAAVWVMLGVSFKALV